MNRKVSAETLAKIHARRRRAAGDETPPGVAFAAGAGFCFLFFTALFSL